jgi:hypothetical protein
MLEGVDRLLQRAARQMEIDAGRLQVGVAEQDLDGRQISAVLQQVCGETVPQGVLVLLMICTRGRSAIAITRAMA